MNDDKVRNRRIQLYSGKKFDPLIHEYQCGICKSGFFVTDDFPKMIGELNMEICPSCYHHQKQSGGKNGQ